VTVFHYEAIRTYANTKYNLLVQLKQSTL